MNRKGELALTLLAITVGSFILASAGLTYALGGKALAKKNTKAAVTAALNKCGGDNPSPDCMKRTDDILTVSQRSGTMK